MPDQDLGVQGAYLRPLRRIPDERGTILHGLRADQADNPLGEVYFKRLYQGVVNGWHIHETLVLNYICLVGMMKLVLYDAREDSPTKGALKELFIGEDNYALVHIPAGVANGVKGVSAPWSLFCNVASEPHNPHLQYRRVDPHCGEIPYDWTRKDF